MNFFKGLVLAILSLILFLSLVVFGVAYTLNSTLLDPDFVVAEVDKLDISSTASDLLMEQVLGILPEEAQFLEGTMSAIVSEVISDQEPWIKEQVSAAIYSGYDFLLGKDERLVITVSLEPLKEDLGESLREKITPLIMELLPAGLSSAPQPLIDQYIDQYFDEFYEQFADEIPSEFVIDESFIPPAVMAQIFMARQIIGYFQISYYGLIGFMVLLVLMVILVGRQPHSITLTLGMTFMIYGALEYAAIFVGKDLVSSSLLLYEVPLAVQPWIIGLADNLAAPLGIFSLGMLIGGVVLIIVSFLVRFGEKSE